MNVEEKQLWTILDNGSEYRSFVGPFIFQGHEVDGLEQVKLFNGNKNLLKDWIPPKLRLFRDKGENKKPIANFMGGFIEISIDEKALSILKSLIENNVELLPLDTEIGTYYGLHVREVDCLDKSRSLVKKFRNSDRVMRVEKYAFLMDKLDGIHIFRVVELGGSRLFVSGEFKKIIEENNLTGLIFYPVPIV